ncbi:HD domain-containing protein [Desulfovibrio sp. OttesenSCG-928-A18]|nr:HD domain-containing protein [Desulfovibrio sp. OttesenSCG-928-A18]
MPGNIRKSLLQFIFSGSYMKRWNDKLRPTELIEIDKQAHKMIAAWMLCRLEGRDKSPEERLRLEEQVVEGGIFDYLFRLVITDIKPPILYRIKANPEHYARLSSWAIAEAEPLVRPLSEEFWQRFQETVRKTTVPGRAGEILAAAHLYSSMWEFRLLRRLNAFDPEMEEIDQSFIAQLRDRSYLRGVPELLAGFPDTGHSNGEDTGAASDPARSARPHCPSALAGFANLCGQLRFQKRWSQTPRIPETSVMGHMFIVACYAYFLSLRLGACRARRVNNFFSGLFHDLPELLTRDIISPVKKSFSGLGQLIREYEISELDRRVFTPLNAEGLYCITERLRYYLGLDTGSEFDDAVMRENKAGKVDFMELNENCNMDSLDPKDGEALKICDILAAYIEAYTAMRNGITSDHIQQAFWRMREQNAKKMLGAFHIGALFSDFD